MKNTVAVLALLFPVSVSAQFVKQVDEDGGVTYSDDFGYVHPEERSDAPGNLEQVQEYLRERDEAARLEQSSRQISKTKIGIGKDSTGINRRFYHRRCHALWRWGLKCQ